MNKQQKIPDGWKWVKLKDLSTKIGSGITPKGGSEVYLKSGVKFLRSQNVLNGTVSFDDIAFISDETNTKMKSTQLKKGDVLYNITGASIGRSAVYDFDDPANVNQHVCIVRLKDSNPKLINTILLSSIGKQNLFSFQAGGNRQGLNYQQLGSFEIPIPPINEQNCIVHILETWDKYIETLNKKIKVKKNIKKGLMQNLLSGKMRLGEFKKEWKMRQIGDCGTIVTGNTPSMDDKSNYGDEYCWATAEDFNGKYINETKIKLSKRGKDLAKLLPKGSILVTCIASIGKNGIAGTDMATNQQINSIIVNKKNSNEFIYYLLNNSTNILKRYAGAGGIPILNKITFSKIKIKVPASLEEQTAIAEVLSALDRELMILEKQLAMVTNQKRYLLNNLITGQIRVPEFASHN